MYINQIDDLIDKILDDFYSNLVKSKEFSKILQEVNFVKYQKLINKILTEYNSKINKKEILKIIKVEDNVSAVVDIIKKYLAIYLFLTIGIFFKGKKETFINNVVEFTKNQSSFNYRINNFFNSESNGILIRLSSMSQNILTLLKVDSNKKKLLSQKDEYKDTVNFLNNIGQEFIEKYFKLKNLSNNAKIQGHNIIKYLIIIEIYLEIDKKIISSILDDSEKQKGEYIYIDIVMPHSDFIDYNSIEGVLSKEDVEAGLAYEIYDLLLSYEEIEKEKDMSINGKITELINKQIVIPVSEDFMLYHKDGEKYEKTIFTKGKRDKSDTKIKYIVSKIDSVSEYYSETVKKNKNTRDEIWKKFYAPLSDRKATLMNNTEEVYIIKKLQDQGRSSIENNEYYNDLINYRLYPYLNFKDFKKDGFNIKLDRTVDVVRGTSFKTNPEKILQMRIGSNEQVINIIGFIIPLNPQIIACQKGADIINIKKINYKGKGGSKKKFDNGYRATLKYLKHNMFRKNGPRVSALWLYDLKKDKVVLDNYEQIKKLNNQEQIRIMIGKLHDDIQGLIYEKLTRMIKRREPISFYSFNKIMEYVAKNTIGIDINSDHYSNLNKLVTYEKYIQTSSEYDTNEDKFPGLYGDIISLPNAPKKKKSIVPLIKINIGELEKQSKQIEKEEGVEKLGAICQHNITWDNLLSIRKKEPNRFTELLIEFTYQYVIVNEEEEAVCRSCGAQINLKKFVREGTHNAEGRYITLGQTMTVLVEDIPEYEKYIPSIRNIDKIVEKVASVANIYTLLETSTNPKFKNPTKQRLIKTCIDLIVVHNKNLRDEYKERNKRISSLYGLDKDLSNLFIFQLDNSIFIYSSKDKDFYKFIKRNNIMVYLIFLMLLDMTDSQIIYMGNDKLCNYYLFEKFGFKMFEGLKIIVNNNNTTGSITDYKVLCYLIFYISCLVTKYNMWYVAETNEQKTKRFDPIKQKMIIHTLIDFINSILEIEFMSNPDNLKNQTKFDKKDSKDKFNRHFLYNTLSIKFFQNLNSVYKDEEILQKLDLIQKNKIKVVDPKNKSKDTETKSIILSSDIGFLDYMGINIWKKCRIAKFNIKLKDKLLDKYRNISTITNCENGAFHQWKTKGKTMECQVCSKLLDNLKLENSISEGILKKYFYLQLNKHAKKYCKSGKLHNFVYSKDTKCSVCVNCDYATRDNISTKALDQLQENLSKMNDTIGERENIIKDKKEKYKRSREERKDKIVSEIKSDYGKTKTHKEDYLNFVDRFISVIEKTIGKDTNIHGQDVFLRYDVFIVDHDHNGYTLPKKFMIKEDENKIQYRKKHQQFDKDMLFYRNNKLQMDIFYDANSFLLLGYKEKNKEYHTPKQVAYLKVNYSIMNRLKLLGYKSKLTDIVDDKEKLNTKKKISENDQQKLLKKIIGRISRNRIQNLKKTITDIQRFLYRIKFNYDIDDKHFLSQYVKILSKGMNIRDSKNKNKKVFGQWKYIKYGLYYKDIENKTVNLDLKSDYISATDINQYDYHGNLILYYIVDQLRNLIEINSDKFVRQKTVFFVVDIINQMHNQYNEENIIKNFNIRRFTHIVNSRIDSLDIEQKGHGLDVETEGLYGEYKDPDAELDQEEVEQRIDAKEEMEAIDMEDSLDYEIDYVSGVNI